MKPAVSWSLILLTAAVSFGCGGRPPARAGAAGETGASSEAGEKRAGEGWSGELPEGWRLYRRPQFGFSIGYPATLAAVEGASREVPDLRLRVRFLPVSELDSPLVDRAVAELAVEVWDNPGRLDLSQWLERHPRLTGARSGSTEPLTVAGHHALEVKSPLMVAPNTWVLVALDDRVFRLVPVGQQAEAMLSTLVLDD